MVIQNHKSDVLEGDIKKHMLRLALPSIGGMFAITIFNLTDTYFVSKLGTDALAAMGFTFPIVMIVGSMASGISMGAGSILARAMGRGDHHKMNRIATDGIILSILAVLLVAFFGILSMDGLFTMLGANEQVLPLVKSYMLTWYLGVVAVIMPPVSDSCMRAMGDMLRPFFVMLVCALANVILDPIFIFGYFGVPAMGIGGAALATVISRAFGMILTVSFVHFHYHLIDFKYNSVKELFESWSEILRIGLPAVIVRLLPQVTRALLTKIAAVVAGVTGVAALAAGSRIESFATIISMAVGVSIIPIIGQNYGAKKYDRVDEMRRLITNLAVTYGSGLFLLAIIFSKPLARIFSDNPEVIKLTSYYLMIVIIGSVGLNLYNWISESFNAIGKPKWSLRINVIGTFLIVLPCVGVGTYIGDFVGMVVGLAIGQLCVGFFAHHIAFKYLIIQTQ